jgi:hypothetical protein
MVAGSIWNVGDMVVRQGVCFGTFGFVGCGEKGFVLGLLFVDLSLRSHVCQLRSLRPLLYNSSLSKSEEWKKAGGQSQVGDRR